MKKYLLSCLALYPLLLCAQKNVDLDRFRFRVNYMMLPKAPLDVAYCTYNVKVNGPDLMKPYLEQLNPENRVLLANWKQLPENGHISIAVKLENLIPEAVSVKERIQTTKDKNEVITSTKTFYRQEVVYSFAAQASIKDYKGNPVGDEILADRNDKQVYRSPEFTLKGMAEGYFVLNAMQINKDLYTGSVNRALSLLSERISTNFGYTETTASDFMWIIGSRKHPEYADNRRMMLLLQEVLFTLSAKTPIDGAREKLQPAIDYFEKVKTNYSSSSKHDRKMRYSSYFNLAVLYYYLDDPQAMMKQASGLALNDYDTKDARGFMETAASLKNQLEQNNVMSRHFNIDTSGFRGPLDKNTSVVTK